MHKISNTYIALSILFFSFQWQNAQAANKGGEVGNPVTKTLEVHNNIKCNGWTASVTCTETCENALNKTISKNRKVYQDMKIIDGSIKKAKLWSGINDDTGTFEIAYACSAQVGPDGSKLADVSVEIANEPEIDASAAPCEINLSVADEFKNSSVNIDELGFVPHSKESIKKLKLMLKKKGYRLVSELKKDTYLLETASIPACYDGVVMGTSCSAGYHLLKHKGDTSESGLEIKSIKGKNYFLKTFNYKNTYLFSTPEKEDFFISALDKELLSCKEADVIKENPLLSESRILSEACKDDKLLDTKAYNYYENLIDKYKKDVLNRPSKALTLEDIQVQSFENYFKRCKSTSEKNKVVNSVDDSTRSQKIVPNSVDQSDKQNVNPGSTIAK